MSRRKPRWPWRHRGASKASIRLCWFGSWGAEHSDFGITSLIPVLGLLNRYEHRHEISLTVVSNHEVLGEYIQGRATFEVHYLAWSRQTVATVLENSHFALLTSGDDQYSTIKSPNRTLLSLASGVPTIVEANAESAAELWGDRESIPLTDNIASILDEVREGGYEPVRERMLRTVQPALDRFRIERIGSLYVDLFRRSAPRAAPGFPSDLRRVAQFIGPDDDLALTLEICRWCRASGIEFLIIISYRALRSRNAMFAFLADNNLKPSVVFDANLGAAETRRLRGAQIVVTSSDSSKHTALFVRRWAARLAVPVMSQGEFPLPAATGGPALSPRPLPVTARELTS